MKFLGQYRKWGRTKQKNWPWSLRMPNAAGWTGQPCVGKPSASTPKGPTAFPRASSRPASFPRKLGSKHYYYFFFFATLCDFQDLEGLGTGGEGDDRGWDGWMAPPTRWTWVWVNSGSWWWTGRPGVLRFMGSQRVGHNWLTELKWTQVNLSSQTRDWTWALAMKVPSPNH